ncbi:hypothetical protein HY310_00670 [Candidatus Microgenomates bacterium]|nr:hypothetical protein [Candidatus Microgenomates bacterium]
MSVLGRLTKENCLEVDLHKYVWDDGDDVYVGGGKTHATIAREFKVGREGGTKSDKYTVKCAGRLSVNLETKPPSIIVRPGSFGCDTDPKLVQVPIQIIQRIVGEAVKVVLE